MIAIGLGETMPRFVSRLDRPALRFIHMLWLPDIKEPAVRLFAQPLYFTTKM